MQTGAHQVSPVEPAGQVHNVIHSRRPVPPGTTCTIAIDETDPPTLSLCVNGVLTLLEPYVGQDLGLIERVLTAAGVTVE